MKTWAVLSAGTPHTNTASSPVLSNPARVSERITASDQLHGNEVLREVLLERQALLDDAVLQQHVLHRPERLDADAAVVGEERARDLVGAQHGLGRPAQSLGGERCGVLGVFLHEAQRAEDPAERLLDRLRVLADRVL